MNVEYWASGEAVLTAERHRQTKDYKVTLVDDLGMASDVYVTNTIVIGRLSLDALRSLHEQTGRLLAKVPQPVQAMKVAAGKEGAK